MAHVGKDYPVAFNRDWSTQIKNYRRAMARDYYFFSPSTDGIIGAHLHSKELRLKEFEPRTVTPPRWWAINQPVNGRMVSMEVVLTEQDFFGFMQCKFEIFDAIQGSVAKGTGGISQTGEYKILAGYFDQAWQPHPALFSSVPGSQWNLIAVPWSDF